MGVSPGMQHVQIKTELRLPVVPVWCTSLLQALSLPRATNFAHNTKMSPFEITGGHHQLFCCCFGWLFLIGVPLGLGCDSAKCSGAELCGN